MAEAGHPIQYHGWSPAGSPWTEGRGDDAELRCMYKAYQLVGDRNTQESYPTYESFKEQFQAQNPGRMVLA